MVDDLDTACKREVLAFVSGYFAWRDAAPAGEFHLDQSTGETIKALCPWRGSGSQKRQINVSNTWLSRIILYIDDSINSKGLNL